MFDEISTEDLEAELDRRSKIKNDKPIQVKNPSFEDLKNCCRIYIDSLGTDDFRSDLDHYIFEAALEAFYGKNVWNYVNELSG